MKNTGARMSLTQGVTQEGAVNSKATGNQEQNRTK